MNLLNYNSSKSHGAFVVPPSKSVTTVSDWSTRLTAYVWSDGEYAIDATTGMVYRYYATASELIPPWVYEQTPTLIGQLIGTEVNEAAIVAKGFAATESGTGAMTYNVGTPGAIVSTSTSNNAHLAYIDISHGGDATNNFYASFYMKSLTAPNNASERPSECSWWESAIGSNGSILQARTQATDNVLFANTSDAEIGGRRTISVSTEKWVEHVFISTDDDFSQGTFERDPLLRMTAYGAAHPAAGTSTWAFGNLSSGQQGSSHIRELTLLRW